MADELLSYFERELSYLRQMGSVFAARYPKVASRLALEADGSTDPHVERFIEAVAFLNARVRRKLDDELPEITDSLLGMLYPHYLAPVPSMGIVQFVAASEQGQLTTGYRIEPRTILTAKPVRGVRCRFRTVYPVTLWPIEVDDAALEDPPRVAPTRAAHGFSARSAIRISLRALAGASFATLDISSLRFCLSGESAIASGLYELLCAGAVHVELLARGTDRNAGRQHSILPAGSIRGVGFAPDEMALPYPKRSFRGYGLLQEYFCFQEKFLFVDIAGIDRLRGAALLDHLEIRIFCERRPRFSQAIRPENMRLGCTPIINLFEKVAEPIRVDHTKEEYLIVPDVHGPWAHEVYSVDSVMSLGEHSSEPKIFEPFYGLRHGVSASAESAFWNLKREPAIDEATNAYISMVDHSFSHKSPETEIITLRLTCTNRDLPALLPFSGGLGDDLDSEEVAPFVRVLCLGKPTPPRRPPMRRGAHWRLISHLALNYLSLVEQGKDALLGILEVYDFVDSTATRRQISGISSIDSQRVLRNVGGQFCRGLRVSLQLDEEHFVGHGMFLFATVLEAFLGLYTSINSFSELVATIKQTGETLHVWRPRAGEQILL